ncbi:MAG: hypothetical protein AABW73_01275 [Nanoarchaeota archaeon]
MANVAALTAALMPYALGASALAGDNAPAKSDLERAVDSVVLTSRAYADGHGGLQTHQILSSDLGKVAYRGENGSNIYGADLTFGKSESNTGVRFNAGYQSFLDSSLDNGRLMLEKSFKDSTLDFLNFEFQDNAKPFENRLASAIGFNVDKFKPQVTADSDGNFGYALVFNDNKIDFGIGGHRVNDSDTFNTAFSYKWSDANSAIDGYKVLTQAKVFDTVQGQNKGFEARVRFGKKAPGGAFLVGTQDTLFNSITPFLGGDGDATFPFGIGDGDSRIDFFGASASNSGNLGSISFDVKYHDEPSSRYFNSDVAVGLGSVSDSWIKDVVLQVGRHSDLNDKSLSVNNADLRAKIYTNADKSLSLDFALRAAMPVEGKNSYSGMLGLTYNFK